MSSQKLARLIQTRIRRLGDLHMLGAMGAWFLELRNMVGFWVSEVNGVDVTSLEIAHELPGQARNMMYDLFRRYFIQPYFSVYVEMSFTM